MILSDRDIKKAIKQGRIKIRPQINFKTQLGSCSIDLRLGRRFRIFNHPQCPYIDPLDKKGISELTQLVVASEKKPFTIHSRDLVLAETMETLELADDLLARLEGRSSIGRLGVIVHSTASVFDPGWRGKVVLEMGNLGHMPVLLYPGMRICSLTFETLSSPAEVPYYKKKGAKYIGQSGPGVSKIFEEIRK
ncbi:dCTP deaminase [Patescibacteria group bacterium]|nr:dCTP deaminase [Patescibacteria group bacterium]MBU1931600.1 dCTP deaminase [Patescibacteria group bacterium]